MKCISPKYLVFLSLVALLLAGCGKNAAVTPETAAPHKHEHKPMHHGTPVVLGNEEYHLELVLDAPAGKLQAYLMDGELENFIRIPAASFEIVATLPDRKEVLRFNAVANNATGEKLGDTSLFEAQADWLKTTNNFDASLSSLEVRGSKYQNVPFNFPKGNDKDEK